MNTDTMTGANVAISGGTGSFGSTMVSHLLRRDANTVHILSRDETKQDAMRKRFSDSRLRFFLGDVRDYNSVAGAFVGTDFVFHAAALKQVPSCEFFPEPGITRGEHYHLGKVERFAVLSGQARISLRKLLTNEVISFDVTGDAPAVVDMPTMRVHNITNTCETELTTLFWANSLFDPEAPDTYWEPVGPTAHT